MAVTPIWPAGSDVNEQGEITFHGRTAESLLNEFGSPLYVIDTDDVRARAAKFVQVRGKCVQQHRNPRQFRRESTAFQGNLPASSPNPAC